MDLSWLMPVHSEIYKHIWCYDSFDVKCYDCFDVNFFHSLRNFYFRCLFPFCLFLQRLLILVRLDFSLPLISLILNQESWKRALKSIFSSNHSFSPFFIVLIPVRTKFLQWQNMTLKTPSEYQTHYSNNQLIYKMRMVTIILLRFWLFIRTSPAQKIST